ncbi:MAG: FtsK/SpoIIIE domain-containing protein [bacterium]
MDVSQSIQYVLVGNRATTSMFAIVPASIALYFQNVFYANFPTSELLREAYVPAKPAYWISYGDKPSLMSDKDYMKEGSYLDPMKDMFGIFDNVDTTDTLTISYYYQFKKEKSKWDAISAAIGKMWKKITEKPEAEKTDAEKEKPEDAIKCSVSIGVVYQPTTTQMAQGVKLTMKALFSKYIHKGSVTVTPERKSTICTLSQVVNFFHLPTTDYSVKSLDYCSYRKLPYPSNLPSTSNTNEKNGLTLLGKTQYRGQEVRFGIKDEDTFRHLYVVGKTGTGKSTFLSNMIKSHMYTNK